jgi:GT2 family glycosyltransferase
MCSETATQQRAGRLVAVVVTFNRLAQLQVTLARLGDVAADALDRIVVVDNASTDGTGDWLAGVTDPRLDIVSLPVNTGGAGGFATGMGHARRVHDPDWIVVFDDDARPEPGALEAFCARPPQGWDALAAAVYFPDGRICEMNRPSRNPFWEKGGIWRVIRGGRDGFHIQPAAYEGKDIVPIDVTSFVGFFISRRGMDMAGLPDPGLFLYGDDGLYTLGLSAAGGRIGFDPTIRFEHACSTFENAQRGRFQPLWKVYYYHRNLLMLYRMAAGWLFWPALLVVIPKWISKVRHHAGERGTYLRLLLRAVRDGLAQRTDVDHARIVALGQAEGQKGGRP